MLRNLPPQQRFESSLQQHRPKQSPFRWCILIISSRKYGEKIVRNEKYSNTTQHPLKKQKLPSPGELAADPIKNDRPSVTEVIVIEGPA